jgi:hypothetical protein
LIANLLTPLCLKWGISANTITVSRLLIAILITFIFFGNSYYLNMIGLFLMAIIISLDILDGKVARETKTTSEFGRFLDESDEPEDDEESSSEESDFFFFFLVFSATSCFLDDSFVGAVVVVEVDGFTTYGSYPP